MGIIYEKLDAKEDNLIEEKVEDTQNGRYYLGSYSLHWSVNLTTNTITVNLMDFSSSPITTRVISREESEADLSGDGLSVKISGDFDSKQLILNGFVIRRKIHMYGHTTVKRYENVVITSW